MEWVRCHCGIKIEPKWNGTSPQLPVCDWVYFATPTPASFEQTADDSRRVRDDHTNGD
jgi:hypothetical protein